ncbi:MAG: hypothetical protein IJO33_04010 [Bacilli bacterium]|nr:hypothetical protein [Bacilli bacterium]
MTQEELKNKMYELRLEIAKYEYDHHSQYVDAKESIEKLKEEYAKVKKELMKLKLEERRNR